MELRLILLLIGAAVIAAVYLLSRRPPAPADKSALRAAPTLAESDFPGDDLPSEPDPSAPPKRAPIREQGEQLILALHLMPKSGENMPGADVLSALEACGLKYGRYKVYHRLEDGQPTASVFSIANMVEPGSFDPEELAASSLPGLTLFMVLPGPRGGVAAYADMLATARRLAQQLEGEVLDESRSTLTRQTARHIRERIIQFEHQLKLRRPS